MRDLGKLGHGTRADPLGGGVRNRELRVLRLYFLETAEQAVIFSVRDAWIVENIVAAIVLFDFPAK